MQHCQTSTVIDGIFISEILTHDLFHLAQLSGVGDLFMIELFESLVMFHSLR